MRRLIVIVVVIAMIAGLAFFLKSFWGGGEDAWVCIQNQWVKHGNPSAQMPASGCGLTTSISTSTPPTVAVAEFKKTGYLTRSDGSAGNNGWNLLYEEPGAPALRVSLRFTSQSACHYQDKAEVCVADSVAGDLVTVRGIREGGSVVVRSMDTTGRFGSGYFPPGY
ncbi:MAG: hypothetical protein Q7R98_02420 [Candidatus Jorgensenbacteria bacterium]|nr:hypothetical protein [Candidatus Jorgensenbacteria bacterium]